MMKFLSATPSKQQKMAFAILIRLLKRYRSMQMLRQARWDRAKAGLKENRRLFIRTENEIGKGTALCFE